LKEGKHIEQLFKDRFDTFEVDPGDQLWDKIQSEIPTEVIADSAMQSAGAAAKGASSWLTTVVVGGAIGLVSVAGYYYFENKAGSLKEKNESEQLIDEATDQNSTESKVFENIPSKPNQAATAPVEEKSNEPNEALDSTAPAKSSQTKESKPTANLAGLTNTETNSDNSNSVTEKDQTLENGTDGEPSIETAESVDQRNEQSNSDSNSDVQTEAISNENSKQSNDDAANEGDFKESGKSTKGGNSNNPDPLVNPPSNSVDETPGVIEAYKPANVFTPNGDGNNDVFRIDLDDVEVDAIEVKIFNSYGNLVHEWSGVYGYWDGKGRDGTQAKEGPYPFVISIKKDGKFYTKKGLVTLIRGN